MEEIKRLEKKTLEFWHLANNARGADEKQRYLKLHNEAYLRLKRQKEWLAAMEVRHE